MPKAPLGVISMLLRRSPADRGSACVSVSTTVSVPAPGVIVALALHASLQPPEAVNEKGTACAPELASLTAAPSFLDQKLLEGKVIEALREISEETVVVSHYIAINVAVGSAIGDDRVTCFRPDYCSCTVLDVTDSALHLVERGPEGETRVL